MLEFLDTLGWALIAAFILNIWVNKGKSRQVLMGITLAGIIGCISASEFIQAKVAMEYVGTVIMVVGCCLSAVYLIAEDYKNRDYFLFTGSALVVIGLLVDDYPRSQSVMKTLYDKRWVLICYVGVLILYILWQNWRDKRKEE